tara:strand:+ start:7338 stop:7445 length:108 start_codon:yes stop_codon:yes gene_type:complete
MKTLIQKKLMKEKQKMKFMNSLQKNMEIGSFMILN